MFDSADVLECVKCKAIVCGDDVWLGTIVLRTFVRSNVRIPARFCRFAPIRSAGQPEGPKFPSSRDVSQREGARQRNRPAWAATAMHIRTRFSANFCQQSHQQSKIALDDQVACRSHTRALAWRCDPTATPHWARSRSPGSARAPHPTQTAEAHNVARPSFDRSSSRR